MNYELWGRGGSPNSEELGIGGWYSYSVVPYSYSVVLYSDSVAWYSEWRG